MTRVPTIESNIWKLYAIQALTQALFMIPIIVLFWQSHGLNLREIMILQSAFALTVFILEIPTGYLADRWGRKNTIILGCVFGCAAYVTYATGENFRNFLCAEFLVGIGSSLLSGTVEAMTYDTLLELDREREFRKIAGNQAFFEFNTEAASGILGGLIGTVSLVLPLWLTAVPMACAVFTAATLQEPKRHKLQETKHMRTILLISLHALFRHPGLRMIIFTYGMISSMSMMFFWFFQPYQILVGVPLAWFGVTHAMTLVAGACSAKSVSWFEKRFDDRWLLVIPATMTVTCFLALSFHASAFFLVFFLFSRLAWHFVNPLTADLINRMTTSDVRATVMSVRSFFSRMLFVLASPILGALGDTRGIPDALFYGGVIGGIALLLAFVSMHSAWKEIPA